MSKVGPDTSGLFRGELYPCHFYIKKTAFTVYWSYAIMISAFIFFDSLMLYTFIKQMNLSIKINHLSPTLVSKCKYTAFLFIASCLPLSLRPWNYPENRQVPFHAIRLDGQ